MGDITFLRDIGIVVAAAALGGWTARRLGLSVVVGYLLAGILVSPHLFGRGLIGDADAIGELAQLGLVFLMFGIGLQLSLRRLHKLGIGLLLATTITALLIYNTVWAFGSLAGLEGLGPAFLAAALMVSSSAIISKVVGDCGLSHQRSGQEAMGMTVLEDIVAVVMLSLLATGTAGNGGSGSLATLGWLGVFVIAAVIGGLLVVPRLFGRVDASGEEVRTLVVGGLVVLLAVGAAGAGYSLALGAFLLGTVVSETTQRAAVERAFSGLRDLFSAVFFVSIGMLLDLRILGDSWLWAAGLALGALLVRTLAASTALILTGRRPSDAVRTALMITPLGEFSFLIVQLGVSKSMLPQELFPAAIGASLITSLAAPLLAARGDAVAASLHPLDTGRLGRLVSAYHGLLGRVGLAVRDNWLWKPVRSRLVWATVEVALAVATLAVARPVAEATAPVLQRWTGLSEGLLRMGTWCLLAVAACVPLLAAWRNLSTLSLVLAEAAGRGLERRQLWQPIVDSGLRAFCALFLFNLLSTVIPWDEAGGWAAPAAIAAGLAAVVLFGRRLLRLHSEAEMALRAQVAETSSQTPAWAKPADDWPLELTEVEIDETSYWRGRMLRETELRKATGCSVVQIDRGGVCLLNPAPEERLFPGDKLLAAGEGERLSEARALLSRAGGTREEDGPESCLRTVLVEAAPNRPTGTLADLDLARQTGAQVLGLRRGDLRLVPVPPDEKLLPGDELLILATPAQEKSLLLKLRGKGEREIWL